MANLLEAYVDGLKKKDLTDLPYTDDFEFKGILQQAKGKEAFDQLCGMFFQMVLAIRITDSFGGDEGGAVVYEFDSPAGTVEIVDHMETEGGKIKALTPYFDPRKLAEFMAKAAQG